MIKAQSIGNTIVAFIRGKLYQKTFDTMEERLKIYETLANLNENSVSDNDAAIALFKPEETPTEKQLRLDFEKKKEEHKEVFDIIDFMKEVRDNGHDIFEVIDNSIFVKGINISTPALLINEIKNATTPERVSALLNFWKLCALNPDPRARFDLFKFLKNHNLTLTPSGNFVAYRTVNTFEEGNPELEKFVTQEWLKIRRWKKAPSNYTVHLDIDGKYFSTNKRFFDNSDQEIGNLDDLYNNIAEVSGNVYTDNYTGTCRIKIGEPVVMEREEVDPDPKNSCSKGYHLGNQSFMKANMGYFGKVGIVALVNPRHVTSVPEYDSGKLRTCNYLPIAIAELDENGFIKDVDIDVFDLEMAQNTQEELEEMKSLSSTALEEYKKHEFIAPEINFNMITNILDSVKLTISEANDKIKNRVVKVN